MKTEANLLRETLNEVITILDDFWEEIGPRVQDELRAALPGEFQSGTSGTDGWGAPDELDDW